MARRGCQATINLCLAEAVAAGAALLGVGVVDVEAGTLEAVYPVDGGALEHGDAGTFNADGHTVEFDRHIVVELTVIEEQGVAHTGTAARLNGDTQEDVLGVLLGLHELANLVNGGWGKGEDRRSANLLSHTQMVPGSLNPLSQKKFFRNF